MVEKDPGSMGAKYAPFQKMPFIEREHHSYVIVKNQDIQSPKISNEIPALPWALPCFHLGLRSEDN